MWLWSTIFLAIVVSIDSLGVGITYGVRRLKIPFSALVIIGMCSAVLLSTSIFAGSMFKELIHENVLTTISGFILVAMGGAQLIRGLSKSFQNELLPEQDSPLLSLRLKPLGIIISVSCDPTIADLDSSGHIDLREASILGIALGLDSLGIGLSISLADFSLLIIPCVFAGCILFVYLGQLLVCISAIKAIGEKWFFASSVLLMFMGTLRMMHLF